MPARIKTGSSGKPSSRMKTEREGRLTTSERILMASSLQSYARIDHGIENIDQQVHRNDHGAAQEDDGLDHGKIPESDSLVEQPPDAGPGEHGLYDHRHVDHDHQVDSRQRQHRDEGVL